MSVKLIMLFTYHAIVFTFNIKNSVYTNWNVQLLLWTSTTSKFLVCFNSQEGNPPMELHLLKSDLLRHLYKITAHYPHLVASSIIQSKDLLRIIMEHERDVSLSIKLIKIAHRAVEVDKRVFHSTVANYFFVFWILSLTSNKKS